jgi:hypothetical protein
MKKSRISIILLMVCLVSGLVGAVASAKTLSAPAAATISVTTAAELMAALLNVQPGGVIQLADGRYVGNFVATVNGTAGAPITLQGSRNAILDGNTTSTGYVLYLKNVSYWRVNGITVTNGQKAIMTDNANYNLIDGVKAYHTGEEAVAFRTFSSHNTIQNSEITDTGLLTPGYGEGVYIGSSMDNWGKYTGGQPDTSDYNLVLNNHFGPNISAEHVDIKEGTTGGQVSGNYFDGAGMSGANYADSWVDVAGNGYLISNNTGVKAILDGYQTHIQVTGWAANNTFRSNISDVQASGYGFHIHTPSGNDPSGNVICTDNVVTNAASGAANVPLTNCGSTTPPGPSPTASRTFTPGLPTATRTNTPVPLTSTRTNTPGITNTPTRTPTIGITNTPTRTSTAGPSPTGTMMVTRTSTPTTGPTSTSGTGTCSPVTSTITAPFTYDGAGAFCWQSSNLGAYINSWNLTSLTVNGVNETNLYVAAGSYPAKINGYWYVSYNSSVAWGHFEAK